MVVGAYNVTFNKTSYFVVRCRTQCFGQSVRRAHWFRLMEEYPTISRYLQRTTKLDYQLKISSKVIAAKNQHVLRMQ